MKRFLALCLLILVGLSLTPSLSLAATTKKPFGAPCSENGDKECASNDCEEADSDDDKIHDKWFCDCSFDSDCADVYQSIYPKLPVATWDCVDGTVESADLDYCTNASVVEYPLGAAQQVGSSNVMVSALKDTPLTESEIDKMLKKPEPRITIPGLKFSDASINGLKSGGDGEPVYLNFPFLGEYLAVVYKYAIVVMSILAVAMIIVSGFQWIIPDSSGENISSAKKRIAGAVTGLILAVGSYTILYTINPELVQFRSLRVRYIAGIADGNVHDDEGEETGPAVSGVASSGLNGETTKNRCHLVPIGSMPEFDLNTFTDKGNGQCLLKEYAPQIGSKGLDAISDNITSVNFLGKNLRVHKLAADAFKNTEQQILQSGSPITQYWVEGFYTAGTWVDSKSMTKTLQKCEQPGPETWVITKKNNTEKSRLLTRVLKNVKNNHDDSIRGDMHSLGLAIDVYSLENPDYGDARPLATQIPSEVADAFYAHGFSWLGATGGRDTMHFQYFGGSCFTSKGNQYPPGGGCCMNGWKKGNQIPTFTACGKQGGVTTDYLTCLGPGAAPGNMWIKENR